MDKNTLKVKNGNYGSIRVFNYFLIIILVMLLVADTLSLDFLYEMDLELLPKGLSWFVGIIFTLIGFPLYIYKMVSSKKKGLKLYKIDYLYILIALIISLATMLFSLIMPAVIFA